MAFVTFPEPKDLPLKFEDMVLDGRPKDFQQWNVSNPHPGFGKDPNILNEFGHTKYPMYVGSVIVNNEEEEKAERAKLAGDAPATPEAPTKAW
jgi:hypothetical protein